MDTFFAEFMIIAVVALRSAAPVLAVVIGETLTQRSGVINLGVEGQMLLGAMIGFATAVSFASPWLGVLAACGAGLALSSVHAALVLGFKANQIASGVAVLILGTGLSAFYGIPFVGQQIRELASLSDTWIGDLPVVGNSLALFTPTVWLVLLMVPMASLFLYRTRLGLKWRASGESLDITTNLGNNPAHYQLAAILLGGLLSGFAGAALAVDYTSNWVEGMTNGRGLVAVGLVIVARWNPWLSLPAALLYGASQALSLRMQSWGVDISAYLLSTLPYLIPLLVMMLSYRSVRATGGGIPAGLRAVFKST